MMPVGNTHVGLPTRRTRERVDWITPASIGRHVMQQRDRRGVSAVEPDVPSAGVIGFDAIKRNVVIALHQQRFQQGTGRVRRHGA